MRSVEEAVAVLKYRHALTGQGFNGDEEARVWLDLLGPHSVDRVNACIAALSRLEGKVQLRDVRERLDPPARPDARTDGRRNVLGECLHVDAVIGQSCLDCRDHLPPVEEGWRIMERARAEERAHRPL